MAAERHCDYGKSIFPYFYIIFLITRIFANKNRFRVPVDLG